MKPHYCDDSVTLYHGDCLDVLAQLPDASVDSVVTDPPYGLEFMGKEWDAPWKSDDENLWATRDKSEDLSGKSSSPFLAAAVNKYRAGLPFQQWCEKWAAECLRVLKPGGHLLAFGGTRTWHRLACAVEDAGFEIRDSIAWLYGSGFPKSLDVSKAIDKAAGIAREDKFEGAFTRFAGPSGNRKCDDCGKWLVSGSPCKCPRPQDAPQSEDAKRWQGWGTALKPAFEPIVVGRKPLSGTVAGTVLAHGVGALNIDGCRVAHASAADLEKHAAGVKAIKARGGSMENSWKNSSDLSGANDVSTAGRWPSNVVIDPDTAEGIDQQSGVLKSGDGCKRQQPHRTNAMSGTLGQLDREEISYGVEGGASRFFPTFRYQAKAPAGERPTANGVAHPTVKPLDLMRWLVRLVTPPGGLVLEPFAGSGTTAEACIHEHMRCIAIERETDYLPLIVARLSKPMEIGFDFEETTTERPA
jgi:site-specific DNA-methyltransferase (adenine-specific)